MRVVIVLIHYGQQALGRYIENSGLRYRIRKHIAFAGYRLVMVLISIVFSDKLPGLTVFFGAAGADAKYCAVPVDLNFLSVTVCLVWDV